MLVLGLSVFVRERLLVPLLLGVAARACVGCRCSYLCCWVLRHVLVRGSCLVCPFAARVFRQNLLYTQG